ncbi:MAG: hypothetical protein GQ525_14855, partial [Draconibacterium sp.]|nr:hypothetical protein [Draconibacterium sp.]
PATRNCVSDTWNSPSATSNIHAALWNYPYSIENTNCSEGIKTAESGVNKGVRGKIRTPAIG